MGTRAMKPVPDGLPMDAFVEVARAVNGDQKGFDRMLGEIAARETAAREAEAAADEARAEQRRLNEEWAAKLEKREDKAAGIAKALARRQTELDAQDARLKVAAAAQETRRHVLDERESAVQAREDALSPRADELSSREAAVASAELAQSRRRQELEDREAAFDARERERQVAVAEFTAKLR